jgi:hypothetical protein
MTKRLNPYAGDGWLVRGKVAETQTRLPNLRQSRRRNPDIVFIPILTLFNNRYLEKQDSLNLNRKSLVGGAVGFLFSVKPMIWILNGRRDKTAGRLPTLKGAFYVLDENTDTGRAILFRGNGLREVLDFASFRKNQLEADLTSRDFSINSLAYNLRTKEFKDPAGGLQDLRSGIVRACSESTFSDDPVRILRAVRFAAAGYSIRQAEYG